LHAQPAVGSLEATGSNGYHNIQKKGYCRRGIPFIILRRTPACIEVNLYRGESMDTQERIRKQVTENKVVLYMKGTPEAPQCGFSAAAVQMLEACGAEEVATVDVLADPDIRQGIKAFSNWPTIPQLYVAGEFIGGADIMREMYQSGELKKILAK
jgi:monothiol glutaredoxin